MLQKNSVIVSLITIIRLLSKLLGQYVIGT